MTYSKNWIDALKNYVPRNDTPASQSPPAPLKKDYWFVNTKNNNNGTSDSNSGNSGGSWWGNIWDWANSNQGTSIIGGITRELFNAYRTDKMNKIRNKNNNRDSVAVKLQHERIQKHNESINKPMDMGLRIFKQRKKR